MAVTRPLPAAAALALLIYWERSLGFPFGIILISGLVVYLLALFPCGVWEPEDRRAARAIISCLTGAK